MSCQKWLASVGGWLLLCLLLSGCVSTRPVVKVGLVAPFEGVYRATGYEALAAVRLAIQVHEPAGAAALPLALDSGDGPEQVRRALAKLGQDRAVIGVLGPFLRHLDPAAMTPAETPLPNWQPFPGEPPVDRLLAHVAQVGAAQGITALVLAGEGGGVDAWGETPPGLALPLRRMGQGDGVTGDAVTGEEAVVWLGSPAGGADLLIRLRGEGWDGPFWATLSGGDAVFARRAQAGLASAGQGLGAVYWTAWLDADYPTWAEAHTPGSPLAYALFRATQSLLTGEPEAPGQLYTFELRLP